MTNQKQIERLARFMGFEIWPAALGGLSVKTNKYADWEPFDPFTRLDDAMMVAEKCVGDERGIESQAFSLETISSWGTNEKWCGKFPFEGIIKFGKTPAEAITLAALAYLDATEAK